MRTTAFWRGFWGGFQSMSVALSPVIVALLAVLLLAGCGYTDADVAVRAPWVPVSSVEVPGASP